MCECCPKIGSKGSVQRARALEYAMGLKFAGCFEMYRAIAFDLISFWQMLSDHPGSHESGLP